jgi:hypothetical protein
MLATTIVGFSVMARNAKTCSSMVGGFTDVVAMATKTGEGWVGIWVVAMTMVVGSEYQDSMSGQLGNV